MEEGRFKGARLDCSPMRTIARDGDLPVSLEVIQGLLGGAGSKGLRRAQAKQVEQNLAMLRGHGWARLERSMRRMPLARGPWLRRNSRPTAEDLVRRVGSPRLAWKLLAMSANGYWRQRAVEELGAEPRGDELPVLLLRSADWVPEVRELARSHLQAQLLPRHMRRFLNQWALVLRLEPSLRVRCTFDDLAAPGEAKNSLRAKIVRLALAGLDSGTLSDRFQDTDMLVRRSAFALAFRAGGGPQLPWILGAAFEGDDIVVQTAALRHLASLDDLTSTRFFLELAAGGAAPGLRRKALYTWLELDPAGVPLARLSVDNSSGVRGAARFYLSKRGASDLAQPARDALAGQLQGLRKGSPTRALRGYLAALGETGGREDAGRLAPFLTHSSPRVRRAAAEAQAAIAGRK